MKTLYSFVMLIGFSLFAVTYIQASQIGDMNKDLAEQSQQEDFINMVSGVVQDIQGDWCVVQDSQGTEWKIQVDNYTDTIGNVLPGVTIVAMVEPDGHAKEVKVLPN